MNLKCFPIAFCFDRTVTTPLGSFSQQQKIQLTNIPIKMSGHSNGHGSSIVGIGANGTLSVENGSPAKKSVNGARSDFASVLKKWSAPIPPTLSRKLGRASESPLGKVRCGNYVVYAEILTIKDLGIWK